MHGFNSSQQPNSILLHACKSIRCLFASGGRGRLRCCTHAYRASTEASLPLNPCRCSDG
ncbi:hypothetical protein DAI22_09g017500 [Oryza sativa Japonica Group]|nr:hypothetical protein DAI22_09g017500 [Oryza sativa Japonica Group]